MSLQRIITPIAPLLDAPSLQAGLDNEGLWGEVVEIDQHIDQYQNGFAFVRLSDGYQGWMPIDCLDCASARNTLKTIPEIKATAMVIVPMSHVTSGPDIKTPGLFTLSLGSRVMVLDADDMTTKIAIMSDHSAGADVGFVPTAHIMPLSDRANDWVSIAEALIGSPYKWGGRSAFGLDCSALVQLALAAGGVAITRDSGPQEDSGLAIVAGDKLQRGDLVFWRRHVGIMRDESQLLHANAHHMAVASEPLSLASQRIADSAGPITSFRRP